MEINITSHQLFYVNQGLYEKTPLKINDKSSLFELFYRTGTIDCYCTKCKRDSVFSPMNKPRHVSEATSANDWAFSPENSRLLLEKNFFCSRSGSHVLTFVLLVENGTLQKIGQYPSTKDINIANIMQFRSILKNEFFKEYSTAIGLFSHGVGIGSFVYLRRIIENFIIHPAHEKAKNTDQWNETEFQKKRVKEKISSLSDYLPTYLVENVQLYSIISKGIHELSEDECLKYFPIVKSILDYILTELKEKESTNQQKEELKRKLENIRGEIK